MLDPNRKLNLDSSVQVKLEKEVAESLTIMADHTGISADEIVNTAMKRFIVTHKDYFPEDMTSKKNLKPR